MGKKYLPLLHCHRCNCDFRGIVSLKRHQTDSKKHRICSECHRRTKFASRKEFVDHCVELHLYCIQCDRFFQESSDLLGHLSSSIHQTKFLCCPGKDCAREFVLISGLTAHLESGACKSGITRPVVNKVVVRLDAHSIITNPNRLIAGPDGYKPPEPTHPLATESAWNGSSWSCFLCSSVFKSLRGLNCHLTSQVHDEAIYRCPNKGTCKREFKALSLLCAHVQTNKCGVNQMLYAKEAMESLVAGFNTLQIPELDDDVGAVALAL